ncbi:HNH endonuclease signature motif containing protein [Microbacterium sp. TNHR37B]|uniref:HNH endonuclease signature motif containing protein n=1 Tax=Microbacterium sp. TNHR37B TaxID=1775956 RepID=UPI0007B24CCA|nr:HNH endonuclease signature motif containing protein [Microbacterium sp. TNHR37B]KZE88753.1 hypothetical protein AVP41_03260 [Microbacterium sp. TNHR37B]
MTHDESGITAAEAAAADRFVERALLAHRAIAAAQAAHVAVLAEAHAWARSVAASRPNATSRTGDLELRDLAAQVGAALRVSDRTIQRRMDEAATVSELFPTTLRAWSSGEIDRGHVSAIVDAGLPLTRPEDREWFERRALDRANELTPAQLRPVARTLAEHAHPRSLDERHARARGQRRVVVTDLDDGMARLIADLPAVLAYGIRDRLTTLAHHAREAAAPETAGDRGTSARDSTVGGPSEQDSTVGDTPPPDVDDTRSLDEVRADVFADLLLAGVPTPHGETGQNVAARVQVTIPVLTVLGRSSEPCLLVGYGPIPLADALELAATAPGWDRVLTSPVDGSVLAVDRYRPSSSLRRLLRARDEHCRFVGCRLAVSRCDADHTIDHAHGGQTRADNLATLCRRHHVLKHRTQWQVEQVGRGLLRWQSPGGRSYVDRPAPMVRFLSDADPPPF